MDITLNGPHTVVVLNGIKVTDYTVGDPLRERRPKVDSERGARPDEGWIGLQGYSEKEIVFFKKWRSGRYPRNERASSANVASIIPSRSAFCIVCVYIISGCTNISSVRSKRRLEAAL